MSNLIRNVLMTWGIALSLGFFACTGGSIGTDNPSHDYTENGSSSSDRDIGNSAIAGSSIASMPSSSITLGSSSIISSWDPLSSGDGLPYSSGSKDVSSSGTPTSTEISSSSWNPFKASISYGEFTDPRDGKVYKTVIRGTTLQVEYFAQNLDVGTQVSGSSSQAADSTIEKYCYNDDPANCAKFGGLYQWAEAMGFPSACNTNLTGSAGCVSTIPAAGQFGIQIQGICPDGWHIMNNTEWGNTYAGLTQNASVLRATAGGWTGANTSGFSAVPGGYRDWDGSWEDMAVAAYFWLPEETTSLMSNSIEIFGNSSNLMQNPLGKESGFSIRCARNY